MFNAAIPENIKKLLERHNVDITPEIKYDLTQHLFRHGGPTPDLNEYIEDLIRPEEEEYE